MFNTKLKKVVLLFFTIIVIAWGFLYYIYAKSFEYNDNVEAFKQVEMYKKLLIKDPNNCLYLLQIAGNYSFMYKIDQAIIYYKEISKKCPTDHMSLFQLGICYLFIGNKEMALVNMDNAIKKAEMNGDKNSASRYKIEKIEWISKEKDIEKFRTELKNKKPSFIKFINNYSRYLAKKILGKE